MISETVERIVSRAVDEYHLREKAKALKTVAGDEPWIAHSPRHTTRQSKIPSDPELNVEPVTVVTVVSVAYLVTISARNWYRKIAIRSHKLRLTSLSSEGATTVIKRSMCAATGVSTHSNSPNQMLDTCDANSAKGSRSGREV